MHFPRRDRMMPAICWAQKGHNYTISLKMIYGEITFNESSCGQHDH